MINRIMDASMANDAAPLAEVERLTTTLRDAWLTVAGGGAVPAGAGGSTSADPLHATP